MIEYTVRAHKNGTKMWYLDGKIHCEDGAAIEYADGSKEWYLNGKKVTEEHHRQQRWEQTQSCTAYDLDELERALR